ncbi:MAG: DUF4445 domain-containing protein [Clostridiales bacterium]|jgi:uncharacterized 2Fe-2S/4Fe-4S cluster protein (DUF4445 family)|nr:DUF4445 domain-containing protein [Clostridiales bacterium]
MYEVRIRQGNRVEKYSVPEGQNLFSLLKEKGFVMDSPCGGKGICGKCRVKIVEGENVRKGHLPDEMGHLSSAERNEGVRLSCRVRVTENLVVELPEAGQRDAAIMIEGDYDTALNPAVSKYYIELPKPNIEDQASDVERIERQLNMLGKIHPDIMRFIPDTLRENEFKVTATLFEQNIIAVEGGDTSDKKYGLAVDIGTTTMVGFLMDLNNGRQIDVYSAINPQRQYGADVITRSDFTVENKEGLDILSRLVREEINNMLAGFYKKHGISPQNLYHITMVGNTIMLHLFAGFPVKNIAVSPFTPVIARRLDLEPQKLGIDMCPNGRITLLPMVAGYVGADTVAAIMASGMDKSDELALLIDIGTNGEIALGNRKEIIACSTAAGPAFEGANIRYGMGGVSGAISRVWINDNGTQYATIGGWPARGICGSGIVDVTAHMLKAGILEPTGRMITHEEAKSILSPVLAERMCELDGKPAMLIAARNQGAMDDIYICQKDIREVQLAKAAIAAGANILMKEMGVSVSDVGVVYLAGGFGNYIDFDHAADIGLIPEQLRSRIVPIGNGAGSGARMALLSRENLDRAQAIRDRIRYIELSAHIDFQNTFVEFVMF